VSEAGEPASAVDVAVYGAPDCSLCEEAKAVLRPAAERLGFHLREIDIAGDPALEARYRPQIPVVEIDGRRAFTYHVSAHELEQRVRAAEARRTSSAP
jgi:glutaredoxin